MDDKLTIRKVQNHALLTIVACFVISIFGSFLTVRDTQKDVEVLKTNAIETSTEIKSIQKDIQQNSAPAAVTKAEVDNLKIQLTDLKSQLDKVLNVLFELKTRK